MVEIESVTVKLGEREYTIRQAGFLRSKPWKKRLLEEIKPLFELIGDIQGLKFNVDEDMAKLAIALESLFLDSIDKVYEMLIAYAPELEAEREYIEAHATDKQILTAFQGAVKLADPFGVVGMMFRRFGLTTIGTSSN